MDVGWSDSSRRFRILFSAHRCFFTANTVCNSCRGKVYAKILTTEEMWYDRMCCGTAFVVSAVEAPAPIRVSIVMTQWCYGKPWFLHRFYNYNPTCAARIVSAQYSVAVLCRNNTMYSAVLRGLYYYDVNSSLLKRFAPSRDSPTRSSSDVRLSARCCWCWYVAIDNVTSTGWTISNFYRLLAQSDFWPLLTK